MSDFRLSKRSLDILATVKPELACVVKRAIEISEVDFSVTAGNRTQQEQNKLYEQGRTTAGKIVTNTRNSRHIGGYAVDLLPYVNSKAEWDNSGKLGLWPKIANAMKEAAKQLDIPIVWGGDWVSFKDRPHFELDRKYYP